MDPQSETQGVAQPEMADDEIIAGFIALRDKLDEKKKAFNDSVKPITDLMSALQAEMHRRLLARKTDSVRSRAAGTAFFKEQESITCPEWDKTLDWLKETQRWDMLNAGLNKTAVLQYKEQQEEALKVIMDQGGTPSPEQAAGVLPPGVKYSSFMEVQFRRPSGKA